MAEKKSCANCVNCDKLDMFWACEEYGFYHNGHTPVRCDPPYDKACELWTDDPSRFWTGKETVVMSVIVKGMDVPSDCDGCWHPTCNLWHQTDVGKRHKDCPISPMPEKHGRLIEADNLKETLDYYIREAGWDEKTNRVLGWVKDEFIDSEPTIVEAEG